MPDAPAPKLVIAWTATSPTRACTAGEHSAGQIVV